jgi:hypothetical protein
MLQRQKLMGVMAVALSTAGCASFEGTPRPISSAMAYSNIADVKSIQDQIDAASGDPVLQRAIRNNAVWAHIRAADEQYRQFLVSVNKSAKSTNLGLDVAGVLVSSVGAIAKGAANELSAAAAALAGTRGSINRELYFEKTIPAIEAAMQANRLRVKTKIATRLLNDDVARYPLQQALADLNDYQLAASLNAAIQDLTTASGIAVDQAQRRYDNAIESCGPTAEVAPLWADLNDIIMPLMEAATGAPPVAGSDRAKKLAKLADIHEIVTGKAVAEATTPEEAEAQVLAIVSASKTFCTKDSASALIAEINSRS